MDAHTKKVSPPDNPNKPSIIVIDSSSQDIDSECNSIIFPSNNIRTYETRSKVNKKEEQSIGSRLESEGEQISCIDLNSTSNTYRNINQQAPPKRSHSLLYKEVFVKNPAYTDKKKLAKDQSTLDPFLKNFKQSKYLKTTRIVNSKYHQLTLQDFKKKQNEGSKQ